MKKTMLTCCLIIFGSFGMAQIDANLLLGLTNATTTEMNAISSPILGSILYNTTENTVYQYNGSTWVNVATSGADTTLATDDLTQDAETRTYDMNSQNLGFTNGKVGIGTTTPSSTLHTSGSFATAIRRTTVSTTLTDNDFTLITDNDDYERTITFPAANTCTGRIYIVKNIGNKKNISNITYIKPDGNVEDNYEIPNNKISWFQSDGTDWHLINQF